MIGVDDEDWTVAGDLGLGLGLKPGSLPPNRENINIRAILARRRSSGRRNSTSGSSSATTSGCGNVETCKRRSLLERRKSLVELCEKKNGATSQGDFQVLPSFLQRDGSNMVADKSILLNGRYANFLRKFKWKMSKDHTDEVEITENTELSQAQETIATLQGKLDVYQELLYGKYKASEVLLHKLSQSIQEHDEWQGKWKKENEERSREINELQFKLMCTEGNLTDAQRAWLSRFNSLVKENSDLSTTVHEQAIIMRKLSLDNTSLKRENEELLAMQDAKERMLYQRSNSFNGGNDDVGPIELGILGACKCRTATQEPCICAKSACSKHKLLAETQNTLQELEEERNELIRHCQLYRDAFEEQLKRNKMLSKRLLLRDHSEPDLFSKSKRLSSLLRLRGKQSNKNEAVDSLVDMVCDRTDALLQQEIMTKILAQRVQELEK